MPLVVADTGPINYLVLIGHIDILPILFQGITLPTIVRDELTAGPSPVRNWIANPPVWIDVRRCIHTHHSPVKNLDRGEKEAIALAVELRADLLSRSVTASKPRALWVFSPGARSATF